MNDYEALTDRELLLRVRQKDADAFGELSTRYFSLICKQAARFGGANVPERDDLLQEGLLALYSAAVSYTEEKGAAFRTFAGVCIQNRMADAVRRHTSSRNRALNESLSLNSEAAAELTADTQPQDTIELREQLQGLFQKLDDVLTPLEREAVRLHLSGCKREDIPARSGISLKAFDNAIYRARVKLRTSVEDSEK